ncbi:MAG: hypothetical protein Q9221_003332 [Calogaya cf. arnoldii]
MRRRLWWPLVFFDSRMAELGNSRIVTLDPTWDYKVPLNVSDTAFWPEMKSRPAPRGEPTDAIFAVVRSELGDYMRHTSFHLEFGNPALILVAKHGYANIDHLIKLEQSIGNRYLEICDQENPLHFMTIWTTRGRLSKYRLMVHNSRSSDSSLQPMEVDLDAATHSAIKFLECNTKMMSSSLTKGFAWLNGMYFPFPGFYQIAQNLKRRPFADTDSPIFQLFPKLDLQAWEAYESNPQPSGQALTIPKVVVYIKETLARIADNEKNEYARPTNPPVDLEVTGNPISMSMPAAFDDQNLSYGMEAQGSYLWTASGMSPSTDPSAPFSLDTYMNQMDRSMFG